MSSLYHLFEDRLPNDELSVLRPHAMAHLEKTFSIGSIVKKVLWEVVLSQNSTSTFFGEYSIGKGFMTFVGTKRLALKKVGFVIPQILSL